MPRLFALFACALLVPAAVADAGLIQLFSSRTDFENNVGPLASEDFESFTPQVDAFASVPYDFGDFSVFNGDNPPGATGGDIVGSGEINGNVEIGGSTEVGGAIFQFEFDQAITAIGFEAFNLVDPDPASNSFRRAMIEFNNADSDATMIFDTVDQTRFWGFKSQTAFTTMTIRLIESPSGTDGFRIDDVSYARASDLPEPASLAVFALLGVGLMVGRRRLNHNRV